MVCMTVLSKLKNITCLSRASFYFPASAKLLNPHSGISNHFARAVL